MAQGALEEGVGDIELKLQESEARALKAETELDRTRNELYKLRFQALASAEMKRHAEACHVMEGGNDKEMKYESVYLLQKEMEELRAAVQARTKEITAADEKLKSLQYALDNASGATLLNGKPSDLPNPLPVPGEKPHSVRQAIIPPDERVRLAEDRLEAVLALPDVDAKIKEAQTELHLTRQQREEIRDKVYGIGEHDTEAENLTESCDD